MSNIDNEEQVQELKEFFVSKWKIIASIIIIGLVAIWGWRYWQSYQTEKAIEASDKYELLISKLDPKQPESVNELVVFAEDNGTIYSVFANLKAAKFYVEELQDYAGAESLLIAASEKTDSKQVLPIIYLRIARVQYQQQKYEQALTWLDKIDSESWAAVAGELRGDILFNMEKYSEACNAYEVALTSTPTVELEASLKMKLNEAQYQKEKQAIELEKQEKLAKEQAEKEAKDAEDKKIESDQLKSE